MLYPKCLRGETGPAVSATGYVYPCCWLDAYAGDEMDIQHIDDFFKREELKIRNVESLSDIYGSVHWKDFFDLLENNPVDAPVVCHKKCGSTQSNRVAIEL